jgi:hypothetical protein
MMTDRTTTASTTAAATTAAVAGLAAGEHRRRRSTHPRHGGTVTTVERWRLLAVALVGAVVLACAGDDDAPQQVDDAAPAADDAPQAADDAASAAPRSGDCSYLDGDGAPWTDGPTIDMVALADGGDGPRVSAAVYPLPGDEGDPWSQWGQGLVLPDGRFLSALGDHLGRDGNSYLYEYQPDTERLVQIGDVASVAGHEEGDWGYGKVHAQMVAGPCGEVYAASYWGTRSDLELGGSYDGDVLLRLDPAQRTTTDLGTILEGHGVPSMAGWTEGGLIYAEAADPELFDPQRGAFVVIDMATGERVFATDDEEDHRGFRSMAVDVDGRVMFSRADGHLARWDPETGDLTETDIELPGEFLRASTPPAPDGTVYLVTQEPDTFFALAPDGSLRELGEAEGYTASLAMAPDGSRLWYVPDAHGGAAERGTPVIELDTETGEQQVVVELDPLARDALDLSLGGTYNIAVDAEGDTLYIGMNAAPPDSEDTFGEVVLVVVELE